MPAILHRRSDMSRAAKPSRSRVEDALYGAARIVAIGFGVSRCELVVGGTDALEGLALN
jgi:hypothetical protein